MPFSDTVLYLVSDMIQISFLIVLPCSLFCKLYLSSWWFQPIWNICSSTWIIFPKSREETSKNIRNHHLDIVFMKCMYVNVPQVLGVLVYLKKLWKSKMASNGVRL